MSRVYNFAAGPAILPEPVLREAAAEMLDYQGTGMSVMEMSHRSAAFENIIEQAEADLRELMDIPSEYRVLFLQGGATLQFAAIPMNLLDTKKPQADYIVSGGWSGKAYKEAIKYGDIHLAGSSEDKNYTYVPAEADLDLRADSDYVYICENETVYGNCYSKLPHTGSVPLVADVSSCFLSRPVDISNYGVMFGGVQKNIGPAGVTIVIVRKDLIKDDVLPTTPSIMRWKVQDEARSLSNTPPCYGIYMCGKTFQWIKKLGGLKAMSEINHEKAALLYDYLDSTSFYSAPVLKEYRSIMNVPFVTKSPELDAEFIKEAASAHIVNIKGHRSVGGMRASIYNAMPLEGVRALVEFMQEFERNHK